MLSGTHLTNIVYIAESEIMIPNMLLQCDFISTHNNILRYLERLKGITCNYSQFAKGKISINKIWAITNR